DPAPISMPVSAFDSDGNLVTNLQPTEFKVFLDDRQQDVLSVELRREPLNIILLFDTSTSTDAKVKQMQEYALAFIRQFEPGDKVMVASFNQDLKILAELTEDREFVTKAIRKLRMGDGTSLYDAIDDLIRKRIG